MRIGLASVLVDDLDKALKFYTEALGFVKKTDMPVGPGARWLTVVSPEGPEGIELLLEPMGHPAAPVFQKALYDAGIPYTSFLTDDIEKDVARMKAHGVVFRVEPAQMEYGGTDAMFEDGCGNLINLHQV
ncbi:MAG TPA: VOC family protein [Chloroflexia bacterium]|jgi:catechol 2,3-dioxygenase-like lactoylglutathione lyase family enzyme|nr:VOC family protein [Chloroflexia bacterium]